MISSTNKRVIDTFTRQNGGSEPPYAMECLLKEMNHTRIGFAHVIVFSTISLRAMVKNVTFRSMGILYGNFR